jgi:hypothetical protein
MIDDRDGRRSSLGFGHYLARHAGRAASTHAHTTGVHQDLPRPAAPRTRPPALATLTGLDIRHHGRFAYITGHLPDGTSQPLCRLRYGGYANQWGFAIWLASTNRYEDSVLPSGMPVGTAEEALDCACGLYLNDPTAWRPG